MSELEEMLAFQIKCLKLQTPEREYRFNPDRRYRADFAWPEHKLLVEVEGGTWIRGRHSRGRGFENDCEKYNLATLDGWRVLRFTTGQIERGWAVSIIEAILRRGK